MKTSNISLYYPRSLDKVLFIQGTCLRQNMLQRAYWFVRMAASLEPWRGRGPKRRSLDLGLFSLVSKNYLYSVELGRECCT